MDLKEPADLETLKTLLPSQGDDFKKECHDLDKKDEISVSTSCSDAQQTKREEWTRGLDFILSLLGYAVGLGNLWRFPYLCMRNGGGAFLIPFLFCVVTCGMPLFFLEVSVGQFLGKSCIQAWVVCPIFKGLGIGMLIMTSLLCLYYNMIIGWTLYYIGNSFRSPLPWTVCDGWWNTEKCYIEVSSGVNNSMGLLANGTANVIYELQGANVTQLANIRTNTTEWRTSEEEFWQYNVLQISPGLEVMGGVSWYLVLSLLGAWVIVFLCIMKGVRTIGKVVYVTALAPYIFLTILLIRGLTLPGATDGILYYLRPDLKKMMRIQVWVEAALQVFFSLGPGWGPLISMASYNKFNNNCLRDAILVSFVGEGTSVFSGLVVFTILGFIAHDLGVPIEEVVKSGPGLGFVAYPQALARLPVPQLWSVLFFLMLLTVGLDSQFTSVEAVLAALLDSFPRLRKRRVLISALVCMCGFVVGLCFCFQGGIYLFQLVDWYIAIIAVPIFGFIECIIFGWIYGVERFSRDIELMLGRGVPMFMRICWCVLTPAVLISCLVFTLMTYKPPSYGDYNYPPFAQGLGWLLAFMPLLPVLVMACYQLYKTKKFSILKRLIINLKPSSEWKPHDYKSESTYQSLRYDYSTAGIRQRIKVNLIGENNFCGTCHSCGYDK